MKLINYYIKCESIDFFIFTQKYLFHHKHCWRDTKYNLFEIKGIFPLYIYSSDENNKFIYNSHPPYYNKHDITIEILRKFKLEKLNKLKS